MPINMFSLPEIPGRFPVGATTFLTRVRSPRTVGSVKLRNEQSDAHQSALYLEEVAFTAYYPADTSKTSKKGLDWILRYACLRYALIIFLNASRPVKESVRGFAKFTSTLMA